MLQKIGFQPGINKQITPTGAEGQWVDCDNVRFRYQTPEKFIVTEADPLVVLNAFVRVFVDLIGCIS